MRLSKIVATLGPSSDSKEQISALIDAGVNVFRLNFKHNTTVYHEEKAKLVKSIAKKKGVSIGVMLDLQGPSIRLRLPSEEAIEVKIGDKLQIVTKLGDDKFQIALTHPQVIPALEVGAKVLVDDGTLEFVVCNKLKDAVEVVANRSGKILANKSVNLPGVDFDLPILTERDLEGIEIASRAPIDFLAMSFVRNGFDLDTMRAILKKKNMTQKLISKIETFSALQDLPEIVGKSDAVMVARGDLGVEIGFEKVPHEQKRIISLSRMYARPVITATQMLQSMVASPTPTRAEVSDVAGAVFDKTDAVMLSSESASGQFPVESVAMLASVSIHNEVFGLETDVKLHLERTDNEVMVAEGAFSLFLRLRSTGQDVGGFLVFTRTGRTARLLSALRARVPIFTFACNEKVRDELSLSYGVQAFDDEILDCEIERKVTSGDIQLALAHLQKNKFINTGQKMIVLHGDIWNQQGGTNTIKVVEV